MPDLKISIIQSELYWEDKQKNLDQLSAKILSIKEQTDLIVLPEMFSTGFTMNAINLAEKMDGTSVNWMKEISTKTNSAIVGSLIIEEGGRFYNRLIWMTPGEILFYDKRHLFSYAGEDKTYTAGKKKLLVQLKDWNILPLICYDLRFPVWSRRTTDFNYDLLLYVANWPERRIHAWKQLLIARAIENQSYTIGLNRYGNDGNNIFHSGDSTLIDFKGESKNDENLNREFIKSFTLSKEPQEKFREQFAFFEDRDEFTINSF